MRYRSALRERYRAVLGYTGLIFLITALGIVSPLLALLAFPQEASAAWAFLAPAAALGTLGWFLWRALTPAEAVVLTWLEGAAVVLLTWTAAIATAVPVFVFAAGLTFTQAVFEATSAWTTTGLSVVDVTQATHLVLLYRSVLELVGGAGFAIIMLSAMASAAGTGLSSAEGRGEQLVPHVRRSAYLVLTLYAAYAAAGTLGLRIAGMGWFDAVNHSFAAVSTGGFSTRPESIGYWDSAWVEAVTIVLMMLGTLNFLAAYTLLHGNVRTFLRNGEVRLVSIVFPLAAAALLAGVALAIYPTLEKSIRVAVFEVVSAGSTTGFSTVGYTDWPPLGWIVLILLMLIGGGAGSTAGGMKQFRVYLMFRALVWQVQRLLLPPTAVTAQAAWMGDRKRFLDDAQIRDTAVFIFLYLSVFSLGTTVLVAYGYSLPESLFEFASALGTVGLSVGVTAADAPSGVLWAEIAAMFLGRLEFFTVIVGLVKLTGDAAAALSAKGPRRPALRR